MSVRVFLCCAVPCRYRPWDGLITRPGGPTKCLNSRALQGMQSYGFFMLSSCWPTGQPPRWTTAPCRLSTTIYSIYFHLSSMSGGLLVCLEPQDAPCHGDNGTTEHTKCKWPNFKRAIHGHRFAVYFPRVWTVWVFLKPGPRPYVIRWPFFKPSSLPLLHISLNTRAPGLPSPFGPVQ
jgi:hypothetical protein